MLELVSERIAPRRADRPEPVVVMDEPHVAVWQAVRHLFPPHAVPTQVDYGYLMVSWSVQGQRRACTHFAAPVIIRIMPGLLLALWTCEPEDRDAIAGEQAESVREQLAGYDPHSRVPRCGVVILGD